VGEVSRAARVPLSPASGLLGAAHGASFQERDILGTVHFLEGCCGPPLLALWPQATVLLGSTLWGL
jgi:hypothetical protein